MSNGGGDLSMVLRSYKMSCFEFSFGIIADSNVLKIGGNIHEY